MLEHFVYAYREDIIRRCRQKLAHRLTPTPPAGDLRHRVTLCLDVVIDAMRLRRLASKDVSHHGAAHRRHRLRHEFTTFQIVDDHNDVCQAIAEAATDKRVPISAEDFNLLIRCRDEVLAAALAEQRLDHDPWAGNDPSVRSDGLVPAPVLREIVVQRAE